jgi:hypothetical protein
MEVTQEPIDDKNNKKKDEPVVNSTEPVSSSKQEPPVTEIKAKVDLKRPPAEANEPVTLMDDDDFFKQQTNPTDGDLKQKEEDKKKADALKEKLSSSGSSSSSSSSSSTPKPPLTADKRKKQSEKWVKALDLLNTWGLKKWSGQADDVGLKTTDTDKEALAEALADVMEEYNFNPAPLLTLAITTVGVFGNSWTNAYESRQKIRKFRKEQPEKVEEAEKASVKTKPDLDPATGKHNKRRGGQFKS